MNDKARNLRIASRLIADAISAVENAEQTKQPLLREIEKLNEENERLNEKIAALEERILELELDENETLTAMPDEVETYHAIAKTLRGLLDGDSKELRKRIERLAHFLERYRETLTPEMLEAEAF
jgi:chromosome segregation ATPase